VEYVWISNYGSLAVARGAIERSMQEMRFKHRLPDLIAHHWSCLAAYRWLKQAKLCHNLCFQSLHRESKSKYFLMKQIFLQKIIVRFVVL